MEFRASSQKVKAGGAMEVCGGFFEGPFRDKENKMAVVPEDDKRDSHDEYMEQTKEETHIEPALSEQSLRDERFRDLELILVD